MAFMRRVIQFGLLSAGLSLIDAIDLLSTINQIFIYWPKACYQVSSGVIAIFGPQDDKLGAHVQSLCDALDIPHIESREHIIPAMTSNTKEFSINLHPGAHAVSQSLRLLVKFLNWTQVAVIYEDDMCKQIFAKYIFH